MKKLVFTKEELSTPNGIAIQIMGFKGNPADKEDVEQIYIEYYEGKILVHVWNGKQDLVHVWNGEQDPETIGIEEEI